MIRLIFFNNNNLCLFRSTSLSHRNNRSCIFQWLLSTRNSSFNLLLIRRQLITLQSRRLFFIFAKTELRRYRISFHSTQFRYPILLTFLSCYISIDNLLLNFIIILLLLFILLNLIPDYILFLLLNHTILTGLNTVPRYPQWHMKVDDYIYLPINLTLFFSICF